MIDIKSMPAYERGIAYFWKVIHEAKIERGCAEMPKVKKILAAKLLPPHIDVNIMERPRLIEKIALTTSSEPKTIFITAPAGYGKTILMLQLCKKFQTPIVWYQLDTYDNDLAVFLNYLVTGVKQHFPNFGKSILPLINRPGVTKRHRPIMASFFSELAAQNEQNLIIALDDFHTITEHAIQSFIEDFINYHPPCLQMFLASRTTPLHTFPRFSATGKMILIDSREIRFSRDEIVAYFSPTLPDDIIDSIEKETEGWPIALRLIKNSLNKRSSELFFTDSKELFIYLTDEVLQQQSEPIQKFLINTSVLEVLTPEYCDLLLEQKNSGQNSSLP
ncbi:MAG: hypothetical protein ACM3WV_00100 [Bacillota bacterium]